MQVYVAYSTENGFKLLLKNKTIIESIIRLFKPESILATDFGKSG